MISRTSFSFFILIVLVITMLFSCNKAAKEERYSTEAMTDSAVAGDYISSQAAIEKKDDTLRKFVRTAELRFKVKDVIKATYQIEDITNRLGGFVTYTHLTSNVQHKATTKISADTSLETTTFSVVNELTIRVPNTHLDSTLKAIAPLVEYMDYRTIKADDIGLQFLSNQLAEQRIKKHEKRLSDAIDNRGKKLRETNEAEENLYYKQENADQAKIANLSLMDRVNYSTITISLYQRDFTKNELIANEKNIKLYEAGFGTKLYESLHEGWKILEAFILFIAQFWGLILVAVAVVLSVKTLKIKLKK